MALSEGTRVYLQYDLPPPILWHERYILAACACGRGWHIGSHQTWISIRSSSRWKMLTWPRLELVEPMPLPMDWIRISVPQPAGRSWDATDGAWCASCCRGLVFSSRLVRRLLLRQLQQPRHKTMSWMLPSMWLAGPRVTHPDTWTDFFTIPGASKPCGWASIHPRIRKETQSQEAWQN